MANSFVDGKAEQVRAFGECAASTPAGAAAAAARAGVSLPAHLQGVEQGLGADMQQLQQGLQSLHQQHTLQHPKLSATSSPSVDTCVLSTSCVALSRCARDHTMAVSSHCLRITLPEL